MMSTLFNYRTLTSGHLDAELTDTLIALFKSVFSDSEGEDAGNMLETLATDLLASTKADDLVVCVAEKEGVIIGCILFTRFIVPTDQYSFLLSPVAVATEYHGVGVGQHLIEHGLEALRSLQASLVFTYGSPVYYGKTGFQPISENDIQAPFPLSQPIGWLVQSLDGTPVQRMQGRTRCVPAFDNPGYW